MIEVYGRVENGNILLPGEFREWLLKGFEGKEFRLTVKALKYRRTNRQNAYYWGVVIPHMVAGFVSVGNNWLNPQNKEHQEMVHEILKDRFLSNGEKIILPDGTTSQARSTTTTADTKEFTDYIERIRMFGMETMGVNIPDPGEIFTE